MIFKIIPAKIKNISKYIAQNRGKSAMFFTIFVLILSNIYLSLKVERYYGYYLDTSVRFETSNLDNTQLEYTFKRQIKESREIIDDLGYRLEKAEKEIGYLESKILDMENEKLYNKPRFHNNSF